MSSSKVGRVEAALRKKLGEDTFEDLRLWVTEVIKSQGVTRDEYREILSRLDRLEAAHVGLREEFHQFRSEVNQRFGSIDQRFNSLDQRLDRIHERFDSLNERLISSIRWTVGTIALFGTIISILVAIFNLIKP